MFETAVGDSNALIFPFNLKRIHHNCEIVGGFFLTCNLWNSSDCFFIDSTLKQRSVDGKSYEKLCNLTCHTIQRRESCDTSFSGQFCSLSLILIVSRLLSVLPIGHMSDGEKISVSSLGERSMEMWKYLHDS